MTYLPYSFTNRLCRGGIVAYTISLVSLLTDRKIEFDKIWIEQGLTEQLQVAIGQLSSLVRNVIVDAPGNGNVTEWCKKPACWGEVSKLKGQLPGLDLVRPVKAREKVEVRNRALSTTEVEDLILKALAAGGMPLDRFSIISSTGISQAQWNSAIRVLGSAGVVGSENTSSYPLYFLED